MNENIIWYLQEQLVFQYVGVGAIEMGRFFHPEQGQGDLGQFLEHFVAADRLDFYVEL
jgi:hypothetical protein